MARASYVSVSTIYLCLCLHLVTLASSTDFNGIPAWNADNYTITGTLELPDTKISEPFHAYVSNASQSSGRSRIDYWNVTKTFQFRSEPDYPNGVMRRVSYMTTEEVNNTLTCFLVPGTVNRTIEPQTVLPDFSAFTEAMPIWAPIHLASTDPNCKNNDNCHLLRHYGRNASTKHSQKYKYNSHQLWVYVDKSNNTIPLRYEVTGFNNEFGSHYDHYIFTYDHVSFEAPADEAFKFDEGLTNETCRDFPGPGAHHLYHFNPMKEFIDGHTDHVDESFDDFADRHDKSYSDEVDRHSRKDNFRQNMRYIQSVNRQNLPYKLDVNHLADTTEGERRMMRGKLMTSLADNEEGGQIFTFSSKEVAAVSESLDWREKGAVTPVKDQAICGSCWAFGTVASLEGTYFLETGNLTEFSEQALMDCSWGFGNNGCDGGESFRAFQWIIKHKGIPTRDSYTNHQMFKDAPYLGVDGKCLLVGDDQVKGVQMELQKVTNYGRVKRGDVDGLKVALNKYGPISVAIDASHRSLSFYSYGVYSEPGCLNTPEGLDHQVTLVGYGEEDGEKYWLIKNSWSSLWGDEGYVKISQRDNYCGVATDASWALLAQPPGNGSIALSHFPVWLTVISLLCYQFMFAESKC